MPTPAGVSRQAVPNTAAAAAAVEQQQPVQEQPAPAPAPVAEPAQEHPQMTKKEPALEKWLAGPASVTQKTQLKPEHVHTEWRHGEILFQTVSKGQTVSKFLVVPDHIEDPKIVLQKMLAPEKDGGWGMPPPSLTISVSSIDGDYFDPTGKTEQAPDSWDRFPPQWTEGAQVPVNVFPENQDRAKELFQTKVIDMMRGICAAAVESKGWLMSDMPQRQGQNSSGAIADQGVRKFKQIRQDQADRVVNLAMGWSGYHSIDSKALEELRQNDSAGLRKLLKAPSPTDGTKDEETDLAMWERLALKYDDTNTAVLGEPVTKRIVYPKIPEELRFDNNKIMLRDEVSHFVFASPMMTKRLSTLLKDLVATVYVVVSGKELHRSWELVVNSAQRGETVILLDNSGSVVQKMASAIERAKLEKLQLGELVRRCIQVHEQVSLRGQTLGGFATGPMPAGSYTHGHGWYDGWISALQGYGNALEPYLKSLPYEELLERAKRVQALKGEAERVDQLAQDAPGSERAQLEAKLDDAMTAQEALMDIHYGRLHSYVKSMNGRDEVNDDTRWVLRDMANAANEEDTEQVKEVLDTGRQIADWLLLKPEEFGKEIIKKAGELYPEPGAAPSRASRRNQTKFRHHKATMSVSREDKEQVENVLRDLNFYGGQPDDFPGKFWTQPPDEIKQELCNVMFLIERTEYNPILPQLPDSVQTSSFIIFDALTHTPEIISEKLTSALALAGGDDTKEMGFAESEKERLKYAWELCVLFRYNAGLMETRARFFQIAVTLTAFLTTVAAVVLNASYEAPPPPPPPLAECTDCSVDTASAAQNDTTTDTSALVLTVEEEAAMALAANGVPQIPEYVELPLWMHSVLALMCALFPMLSTLLIGLQSKFLYSKRWAVLTVAAERVTSEIYMYRARSAEYAQGGKGSKILQLLDGHAGDAAPTAPPKDTQKLLDGQHAPATDVELQQDVESLAPEPEPEPETSAESSAAATTADKSAASAKTSKASKDAPAPAASAGKEVAARDIFYENVNAIQSELMASEVKMASLKQTAGLAGPAMKRLLGWYDPRTLEEENNKSRRRRRKKKKKKKKADSSGDYDEAGDHDETAAMATESNVMLELEAGRLSDYAVLSGIVGKTEEEQVADDGVSLISAEDYLRFRLMPTITSLNASVPHHEGWYMIAQVTVLSATMLAAICGVVGLHAWIPTMTALVASSESLASFDQTSARLEGANGALATLKSLRIWWQSLSRTQQKMPQNKETLIVASEEAIEGVVGAWTQGMLRKKSKVDAAEEDTEEDAADTGKGK
jgi:hypothetical protein